MTRWLRWLRRQCARQYRLAGKMPEEQKVLIDVAAGSGTFAAWIGMAPDAVAVITGIWVIIRIWETETVRKWTGRGK